MITTLLQRTLLFIYNPIECAKNIREVPHHPKYTLVLFLGMMLITLIASIALIFIPGYLEWFYPVAELRPTTTEEVIGMTLVEIQSFILVLIGFFVLTHLGTQKPRWTSYLELQSIQLFWFILTVGLMALEVHMGLAWLSTITLIMLLYIIFLVFFSERELFGVTTAWMILWIIVSTFLIF